MTFLLCDPGWYVHKPDVQNKWDENTHTHTFWYTVVVVYSTGSKARSSRFLRSFRNELVTYFFASVGTFSGSFYFSVTYFGLSRDHGNIFLCLDEYDREGTRQRGQNGFLM